MVPIRFGALVLLFVFSALDLRAEDTIKGALPIETQMLSEFIRIPRGIASSSKMIGWISNASGGIDSIDLKSGNLLLTTDLATQPIGLSDRYLVAVSTVPKQANMLRFSVLNILDSPVSLYHEQKVSFPEWVSVSLNPVPGFEFEVKLEDHQLDFEWEASSRYREGAAPPNEVLKKVTNDGQGSVHIEIDTGKVDQRPISQRPMLHVIDVGKELSEAPYLVEGRWRTTPWQAGVSVSNLYTEQNDGEEVLWLVTRESPTDDAIRKTKLHSGTIASTMLSSDGFYLLVEDGNVDSSTNEKKYIWKVLSARDGSVIDRLTSDGKIQIASIVNETLVYLVLVVIDESKSQRVLRARNLGSDVDNWEYPIEERKSVEPPKFPQ